MFRIILALSFLIYFASRPTMGAAESAQNFIKYVRQDGAQVLQVSPTRNQFIFTDSRGTRSDLGGAIKNCSTPKVRCLNLSGYLLSIPRANEVFSRWYAGGAEFSVVGREYKDRSPILTVQVEKNGDSYMRFTYSLSKGVESSSLQREINRGLYFLDTYTLIGDEGLLVD